MILIYYDLTDVNLTKNNCILELKLLKYSYFYSIFIPKLSSVSFNLKYALEIYSFIKLIFKLKNIT